MSNSLNFELISELISDLNSSVFKEFDDDYNNDLNYEEEDDIMETSLKSSLKSSTTEKEEGKLLEQKINFLLKSNEEKLKAFEHSALDEKKKLQYDEIELIYGKYISIYF